jgi:hypothetical protein
MPAILLHLAVIHENIENSNGITLNSKLMCMDDACVRACECALCLHLCACVKIHARTRSYIYIYIYSCLDT